MGDISEVSGSPSMEVPFVGWLGFFAVSVKNRDECIKPHEDFEPLIDRVVMRLRDDIADNELRSDLLRRIVKSHLWDLCLCESISEVKANADSDTAVERDTEVQINADDEDWETDEDNESETEPLDKLMSYLGSMSYRRDGVMILPVRDQKHEAMLREQLHSYISEYLAGRAKDSDHTHDPVFSSEWLKHLHEHGILLKPKDELDWSGRGQHVEYKVSDEVNIPLQAKKVLGYSATAIVESVQCRRILLARKTVKCNRRLTKENAVMEVQHLQRLQHSHIVRVVGTYTIHKSLCILLYPAADQNLDELMDSLVDLEPKDPRHGSHVLPELLGCLSNAISFIHRENVKHMDIKPKNILVRRKNAKYKVYIADFGIAKAYGSAAEAFTDSPTSFTRTYAAPEVVLQDVRGYSADIFSLGCVFMEIFATMRSTPKLDEREHLTHIRGDDYQSNIDNIVEWYGSCADILQFGQTVRYDFLNDELQNLIARTLSWPSEERPTADDLKRATRHLQCEECESGSEPFVATTY